MEGRERGERHRLYACIAISATRVMRGRQKEGVVVYVRVCIYMHARPTWRTCRRSAPFALGGAAGRCRPPSGVGLRERPAPLGPVDVSVCGEGKKTTGRSSLLPRCLPHPSPPTTRPARHHAPIHTCTHTHPEGAVDVLPLEVRLGQRRDQRARLCDGHACRCCGRERNRLVGLVSIDTYTYVHPPI